ncbi:MAG: ferrous iron transporter B [Anaerovorax sp.]
MNKEIIVALAGNPNVGKSTVFNNLTGMNQHTGNWPGKTVVGAKGSYTYKGDTFVMVDLPGTYSLSPNSAEEEVASAYLQSGKADITVVIADATCLERNLTFILQVLQTTEPVVVCINLMDEAAKKKITIDLPRLSQLLSTPVVGITARSDKKLTEVKELIQSTLRTHLKPSTIVPPFKAHLHGENTDQLVYAASKIYEQCVGVKAKKPNQFDRKLDSILTSKTFGIPIMFLLLAGIFWLTIVGANYPSQALACFFGWLEEKLFYAANFINMPILLQSALISGIYKTLTWVIAVMLPPMAIFFPLFTLLEDFGYLPRVAFNLDNYFRKSCAHGKQSLTMCMGFGCNACAIIGCRIIDSPRERLIAILTNNFVPCNGRFPTLIAIITMFFVGTISGLFQTLWACFILICVIFLGIFLTLLVSRLLSKTILKGLPSSFILELPPYRRPQFCSVIVRSIFDRTLFVLGRAILVAAPAGLLIWIMANTEIHHLSILAHCTQFLDPFAGLLGLDGVILMAFILGFPANEIVFPIMIMAYMSTSSLTDFSSLSQLQGLLLDNGWTSMTALCTMIMCLIHFPCATTCLTIKKETLSWKWTGLSVAIPTLIGFLICFLVSSFSSLILTLFPF